MTRDLFEAMKFCYTHVTVAHQRIVLVCVGVITTYVIAVFDEHTHNKIFDMCQNHMLRLTNVLDRCIPRFASQLVVITFVIATIS